MLERFRKPKPEVQVFVPDVIPKHIVQEERAEKWKKLKYEAKDEMLTFLNTLDRVDLMRFQDAKQFDGTDCEDEVWEAVNESEWCREYPMGEHTYNERIPSIVRDTMNAFDIKTLQKQVDGMQKKLDIMTKLVENTEVTMSAKTALNLCK